MNEYYPPKNHNTDCNCERCRLGRFDVDLCEGCLSRGKRVSVPFFRGIRPEQLLCVKCRQQMADELPKIPPKCDCENCRLGYFDTDLCEECAPKKRYVSVPFFRGHRPPIVLCGDCRKKHGESK